jgi:hypothetical protein
LLLLPRHAPRAEADDGGAYFRNLLDATALPGVLSLTYTENE